MSKNLKNNALRYDGKMAQCLEGSGGLTPTEISTIWLSKYISKNLVHRVYDFCIPLLKQTVYEPGTLTATTAFSNKKRPKGL